VKPRNGGQAFGELKATCEAISKTLDEFRAETRESLEKATRAVEGHDRRIRSLERSRAYAAGGAGTVTLLGAIWEMFFRK